MLRFLLDTIFPKYCAKCKISGDYLCSECFKSMAAPFNQTCPNCRRQNNEGKFCGPICAKKYFFDQLLVCSNYEADSPARRLLLKLKYSFVEDAALVLAKIMKHQFALFSHNFEGAIVVPMATDEKRERMRGFNQAALLAKYLAENFSHLEFLDCLERKTTSEKQTRLKKSARLVNLKNTFTISDKFAYTLEGETVILVDDVATTCSTLNEASRALKNCGVKYICGLTLARGHLFC